MTRIYRTLFILSISFTTFYNQAYGQDDIDYATELAKLDAELDSLSIFALLDSVLNLTYSPPTDIAVRFGYSSNIVNAGRNYGIDQFGLSPGVSFYHKSGIYADYSGYWNSAFDPMYTVSMLSAGYLGNFARKFSYSINYERWLYNQKNSELSNGFKNSLGSYISYNLGPFYLGLDYSYLFNNQRSANRLIANLSGQFTLKDVWIFDRISFLPTISTVYGNDDVTIYYDGDIIDAFRSDMIIDGQFNRDDFNQFIQNVNFSAEEQFIIRSIQRNQQLNSSEKRRRIMNVYLMNPEVQNYLYGLLDQVENQYGIMSYNFSLPISLSIKNWSLLLSYTYALPKSLPGETYELNPIGYYSMTISHRFRISSDTR